MEDTKRAEGYNWRKWDNGWAAVINDRADVLIRPEGNKFRTCVFVERSSISDSIRFNLSLCTTREHAMERGVSWVESFSKNGPLSAYEFQQDVFSKWRTRCRTRADFFNHVFFSVTGVYDWFDGSIVCTNPEDCDTEKNLPIGPIDDSNEPRLFSHVSERFSVICRVPNDAEFEWIKLAYEAALQLAFSSATYGTTIQNISEIRAQETNRTIGLKIQSDLERRFPTVCSLDDRAQMGSIER